MTRARAVAVALVVAVIVAGCGRAQGDALLAGTKQLLADDTRFVSADGASQAFADAAATMLESSRSCASTHRAGDARCVTRAQTAAFFQVLAAEVTGCDRDARIHAREVARAALGPVDAADRAGGKRPPGPPPALPRC
jgi:hypothetical protein